MHSYELDHINESLPFERTGLLRPLTHNEILVAPRSPFGAQSQFIRGPNKPREQLCN